MVEKMAGERAGRKVLMMVVALVGVKVEKMAGERADSWVGRVVMMVDWKVMMTVASWVALTGMKMVASLAAWKVEKMAA